VSYTPNRRGSSCPLHSSLSPHSLCGPYLPQLSSHTSSLRGRGWTHNQVLLISTAVGPALLSFLVGLETQPQNTNPKERVLGYEHGYERFCPNTLLQFSSSTRRQGGEHLAQAWRAGAGGKVEVYSNTMCLDPPQNPV
jgi:hypothetical protein